MCSNKSLYIDSLTYSIRGVNILSNIYFEMTTSSVIGLLGGNGSGKSTFLNIIFGNIDPDNAFMRYNGIRFKKGHETGAISFLPQSKFLPQRVKLKKILTFFDFLDERLYQVDLIKDNMESCLSNLSGGEGRIIETLLILYSKQCICLLDEPFASLSPLSIDFIKEHIRIAKKEKGILISDHHYNDIIDISDKLFLLKNSNLLKIENKEALIFNGYISSF